MEPHSKRVTIDLRNVSAKQFTIPSRAVVYQVQLANMVTKIQTPKGAGSQRKGGDDSTWILDQLDFGKLKRWSGDWQQTAKTFCVIILGYFQKMI